MRKLLLALAILAGFAVHSQSIGYFRYDTVKILKNGGFAELVILNRTKDTLGVAVNVGAGRLEYRKAKVISDSSFVLGFDTIRLRMGSGGSGGSGTTNIGASRTATAYSITSSTGTGATLLTATPLLAGLMDTASKRLIDSLKNGTYNAQHPYTVIGEYPITVYPGTSGNPDTIGYIGGSSGGSSTQSVWVQNIDSLKGYRPANGSVWHTLKYTDALDPTGQGGAQYQYVSASSATGNDRTVLTPTVGSGNGRWILTPLGKQIRLKQLGIFPSTDNTAEINGIRSWAVAGGYDVFIDAASDYVIDPMVSITLESNFHLYGVNRSTSRLVYKSYTAQQGNLIVYPGVTKGTGIRLSNFSIYSRQAGNSATNSLAAGETILDTFNTHIRITNIDSSEFSYLNFKGGATESAIRPSNVRYTSFHHIAADSIIGEFLANSYDTLSHDIIIDSIELHHRGLRGTYDNSAPAGVHKRRNGANAFSFGGYNWYLSRIIDVNDAKTRWFFTENRMKGYTQFKDILLDAQGINSLGFSHGNDATAANPPLVKADFINIRQINNTVAPFRAIDSTGGLLRYYALNYNEFAGLDSSKIVNSDWNNVTFSFDRGMRNFTMNGGVIDNSGMVNQNYSSNARLFSVGRVAHSGGIKNLVFRNLTGYFKVGELFELKPGGDLVDGLDMDGSNVFSFTDDLTVAEIYAPDSSITTHQNIKITPTLLGTNTYRAFFFSNTLARQLVDIRGANWGRTSIDSTGKFEDFGNLKPIFLKEGTTFSTGLNTRYPDSLRNNGGVIEMYAENKWKPQYTSPAGVTTYNALTDVAVSGIKNGQVQVYDSITAKHKNIYYGYVDARAYPIPNNTGVDATAAINKMLSQIDSNAVVYFPRGHYLISKLVITKPVKFIGADPSNGTVFQTSGNDTMIVSRNGAVVQMENIYCYNSTLDNSGTAPTAGGAVYLSSAHEARFVRCNFDGFYTALELHEWIYGGIHGSLFKNYKKYGVYVSNPLLPDAGDWSIDGGCQFVSGQSGSYGFYQESAGGGKIIGNKFNNNGGFGQPLPAGGIKVHITQSTSDLIVAGNSFENMGDYAIDIDTASGQSFLNVQINGNQFAPYSNLTGNPIRIRGVGLGTVNDNIFLGVIPTTNSAIRMDYCRNFIVTDNKFKNYTDTVVATNSVDIDLRTPGAGGGGSYINNSTSQQSGASLNVDGSATAPKFVVDAPNTFSNTDMSITGSADANDLATAIMQPNTGTNVGAVFNFYPKGTGYSSGLIGSQVGIFGSNLIADGTNYNGMVLRYGTGGATFNSLNAGTGTLRPIKLQINGSDGVTLKTNGGVQFNNYSSGNETSLDTTNEKLLTVTSDGSIRRSFWPVSGSGGGGSYINNSTSKQIGSNWHIDGVGVLPNLTFEAPATFSNNNVALTPGSAANDLSTLQEQAESGTNVGHVHNLYPRGTGFSSGTIQTQLGLFGTDYLADQSNFSAGVLRKSSTAFGINSINSGSGTLVPIDFQINGTAAFRIGTNGKMYALGQDSTGANVGGYFRRDANTGQMVVGPAPGGSGTDSSDVVGYGIIKSVAGTVRTYRIDTATVFHNIFGDIVDETGSANYTIPSNVSVLRYFYSSGGTQRTITLPDPSTVPYRTIDVNVQGTSVSILFTTVTGTALLYVGSGGATTQSANIQKLYTWKSNGTGWYLVTQ